MGIEPASEALEVRVRLKQDAQQPVSFWTFLFEVLTTVTFAEKGGKTKQKLRTRVIKETPKAAPYFAGMKVG